MSSVNTDEMKSQQESHARVPSSSTTSSSTSSNSHRTPVLLSPSNPSSSADTSSSSSVTSTLPQVQVTRGNLADLRQRVQVFNSSVSSNSMPVLQEHASSSSSPSVEHPLPTTQLQAVVTPAASATLCQLTLEELLKLHESIPVGLSPLNLLSLCPCCNIMVARHNRQSSVPAVAAAATAPLLPHTASDAVVTVSATPKFGEGFLKLKKELPVWRSSTNNRRTCHEFLRELTELLTATEFPRNSWYRVLPLVVEEGPDRTWVHNSIVTTSSPPATWEDACTMFSSHFESADYLERQWDKFQSLQVEHGESIQHFSNRFISLLGELNLKPTDVVVKKHYLKCLPKNIQRQYRTMCMHMGLHNISESDSEDLNVYEHGDVHIIIKICVRIEINMRSEGFGLSTSHSSHSTSSKRSDVASAAVSGTSSHSHSHSSKKCPKHPTANHSWSECRQNPSNASVKKEFVPNNSSQQSTGLARMVKPFSGSSSGVKTEDKLICYKCNQPGHYASKCPTLTKPAYTPTVKMLQEAPKPSPLKGGDLMGKGTIQLKMPNGYFYPCLVDTGSDLTVIDSKIADQMTIPRVPSSGTLNLAVVNVSAKREARTVPVRFLVRFDTTEPSYQRPDKYVEGEFEILRLPNDDCPIIIGKDLIPFIFGNTIPLCFLTPPPKSVPYHKELPFAEEVVIKAVVAEEASSSLEKSLEPHVSVLENVCEAKEAEEYALSLVEDDAQKDPKAGTAVFTDSAVENEYAIHRERLMQDPEIVIALEENAKITGFCTHPDSVLKLPMKSFKEGAIPKKLYRPQYRIPERVLPQVREGLQRWFDEGKIIEAPPGIPYNNPIVVVPKKDNSGNVSYDEVRNCLDFRGTNEEMESDLVDQFQLPFIRDTMDKFSGCKIFGEFDLQEAFFQFKLHEESRPYTAFTFEGKQYICVGVPFGLKIVPSHFQRVISKILYGLDFTKPYMDNIPFGSPDWETHKQQALAIIRRLTEHNLKIKPASVKLGHSHMRCLGHLVSSAGIGIDPKKLDMIPEWPRPKTGKDLMSFLGFVTFIRDHVRHVADLTGPLEAIKNSKTLVWNDSLEQAFTLTKKAVMTAPFLQYPDFTRPFHVATDASNTGVGGVLFQPKLEDEYITPDNIVAICSKKLQDSQTRWSAYKKEYFGIVYCLRQFRPYIWGRNDLVVYTDHKPLTYVLSSTTLSHTVHGWFDELSEFNFKVVHRPGVLNVVPDCLSRMYSDTYKDSAVWGVTKHFDTSNITLAMVDSVGDTVPKDVTGPLPKDCLPPTTDVPSISALMGEGSGDPPDTQTSSDAKTQEDIHRINQVKKYTYGMTIPTSEAEQKELIEKEHALGHFGITAISRSLVAKNIWWPRMKEMITEVVQNCHDCLSFTVTKTGYNPSGFIHANGPWEHVQIDTSVHLPTSTEGYTTLLVVIDVFTGFVLLRACYSSTAEEIAKELWSIFCTFGFPKILQSDNGHEFVNDLMRVLIKLSGIEHRFITPYNPRADGKVERAVGTSVLIIKKMVHGSITSWPLYVPFAQYALNIKIGSLTSSASFALMFGRAPNDWKDYTKDPPVTIPYDYEEKLSKWKEHQDKMVSVLLPAINKRILSSKNQMVARLNKTRKALMPKSIPAGTQVYLIDPVKANKWQPKYLGPYTVVRRAHHGGYVLRDSTGDILDRHVTIDQLKVPSSKTRSSSSFHDDDHDESEVEYAVEVIRDHRGDNPGNYEFLVKWVGYPDTDNTWEPISNFRDKEVITKYFKSLATVAARK
jgi:hypothetical protein